MTGVLVDTHCHLTHDRFRDDLPGVMERASQAGITHMVTIGTGLQDGEAARILALKHPGRVSCTVGLDPFVCHEVATDFPGALAGLRTMIASGAFVALGEIGLEYHHPLNDHDRQQEECLCQIALAREFGLPVVLHVRDAHQDMLKLLAQAPPGPGVVHSFIGDAATARAYLDLGFHIAFNGTVTFRANGFLREAAAIVPEDRLLVETDSPYLAPMPHRGKRCEPALMVHTLELIAGLRSVDPARLSAASTVNAVRLFGLTLDPGTPPGP